MLIKELFQIPTTMSSEAGFFLKVVALIALEICFLSSGSLSIEDLIVKLPGQPPVNFKQYAGYITVDDKEQRALFYYLVEAETDPQSKPLVLWLNGGPGCSSVAGAFVGHGPFLPKDEGLMRNMFSWNKEANILFVDSPAGVGFSYSFNKSFYDYINDEITARDNLMFLFGWLEQYPKYKNKDFFISGVSYGGHFVPQLAKLVLQSRLKLNLKGVAVGNPLLEFYTDYNIKADYLWSHGLISDSSYSLLYSVCNISRIFIGFMEGKNSSDCLQVYNQAIQEIGEFVNIGEVLIDICLSSPTSEDKAQKPMGDGLDVCLDLKIDNYLNRKDVQQAFHAKVAGPDQYESCNRGGINYDQQDGLLPVAPLLGELVRAGVRVMVFSGDQDVAIPLMGTRILVDMLAKDLELSTTVPYRPWLQEKQVGGWTQVYDDILSFATVRGGGHDSVFSQPKRTQFLFNTFLKGEPLPGAN